MKMRLLNTALAAFLMAGTAQAMADTNTQDSPATLSLSGVITPDVAGCVVSFDKTLVYLQENVNRLPLQGNKALNPTHVMAYISGKNNKGESNLACSEAVKAGQIALKFTGAADDADGTTLANAYTESNGAKGVGLGIFGPGDYAPIAINKDTLNVAATLPDDLRGAVQFNVEMVKLTDQQVTPGAVYGALTVQIERL
ncbi:fimbrial protein [Cronobacter turicensis]|uniref:fimbrial protein n=1 Tax=Cronobacter TaxID=413496 RepID=UPI0013EA1EDA|nr:MULTISPECIES: fimbrial protein [Cronobacter]ELQ6222509.1 fimbrial protein [Cronobacter turicensis]ELQ6225818.1 fimbrial protein [Cronobacter turicensis]ELY4523769.1 fimbrial protein [Cronobacter turicensis]ELY4854652.1 fimbrial protein [Cronobacter turicensis]KAF6593957.1 fimbrial protein [Cronobacter sp. EKM101R]